MKKSSIIPALILLLTLIAFAALAEGDVAISAKNFPDEAFREYVAEKLDADKDGYLSSEEIGQTESINASYLGVYDLTGIEYFKELRELYCINFDIGLHYLDLSKNTKLEILRCDRNNLRTLDLSNNAELTELWCSQNAIDNLDLSHNIRLTKLSCYSNSLTRLDISCNKTLAFLDCTGNNLTELDAHENTELTKLDCHENQLETLNVSDCQKLTELICYGNRLEKLDISNNAALIKLNCASNCLAFLDISNNRQLSSLSCSYNRLAFVDLSNNSNLISLDCVQNIIEVSTKDGKIPYDMIPGLNRKKITDVNGAEKGTDGFIVKDSVFFVYSYDYGRGLIGTYVIDVEYIKTGISSVSISKAKYPYTGSAIEPAVTVKAKSDGKTIKLTKDTDYTVTYKNNVNAGTATVTVKGKGGYTGTIRKTFTISKVKLLSMKLNKNSLQYTGKAQKPNVIVKAKVNGKTITLNKDTDYTVTYENNTEIGSATVTVEGRGNYQGTITRQFSIVCAKISTVALGNTKLAYTGQAIEPAVTVKAGSVKLIRDKDYTVTYKNNVNAGTATVTIRGKGNFKGTITKTFKITPVKILKVKLSKTSLPYTGKARKPIPTVTTKVNGQLVTLVKGTDYTVKYENNVEIGTATVTITGKGNYTGTIVKTFTIK